MADRANDSLGRWLLRECVRANPLYVISAAFMGYGILSLTTEIDPQVGKAGGIALGIVLVHSYELALLAAATIVLTRRAAAQDGIGRDCHGLALVAAIFLAGSFLILDEPIAHWPWLGPCIVPAALLAAWGKLTWYARLPGLNLPRSIRHTALGVLAAHSLCPLLGAPVVYDMIGPLAAQNMAWLFGWLSLLSIFWLLWREVSTPGFTPGRPRASSPSPDLLMTPLAGTWLINVCVALGVLHLVARDWVFDRPYDGLRFVPAFTVLTATGLLWRWNSGIQWDRWPMLLSAAPALLLQWIWWTRKPWEGANVAEALSGPVVQCSAACVLFYLLLAAATRCAHFYWGLLGPASGPAWTGLHGVRETVPHFRALVSSVLAFGTLLAAVLVSLYRERLLKWLAPLPAPAAASPLPSPLAASEAPREPYEPWDPPSGTERLHEPGEDAEPD